MNHDYRDLLSAFHAHGVRYLIVGGYAVIFHSQPRFTKDLDLFITCLPQRVYRTKYELSCPCKFPLTGYRKQGIT